MYQAIALAETLLALHQRVAGASKLGSIAADLYGAIRVNSTESK